MKRFFPLLMIFLLGCSGADPETEEALALRSRCLAATVSFDVEVAADYIDRIEAFELSCDVGTDGVMSFTVTEPEEISGISGTVTGNEGTVRFDDTVLAFPMMADGRLSPLSAPWVMVKAIREGAIVSLVREGELLHLTIDDSYADDALTVDLWIEDGKVEQAEIAWNGRRQVTMAVDDFSLTA